jgi:iron complex outermembrane receptor protein
MTASVKRAPLTRAFNIAAAVASALAAANVQAADTDTPTETTLEEVLVFGRGQSRQVAEVSAIEIEQAAPGTSALKIISKLPGVSFQSADPYGAYEWSTRITVRGFNQNQLGFTLDGVPLGDMSYGNHNGLHISRAISSENIGSAVLSQGAGSLETASSSNLGGTLQFYSMDPSHEFGVNVALTGGSDSDQRGFIRLESGDLGASGARAYLSYTNQQTDKWKGFGEQKQEAVNFKFVLPIGDEGKLTGFYNWSDRQENDYQDLSFDIISRLGYDWDNLSAPSDWSTMVQVAQIYQGALPGPYPSPIGTVDDAYANASGLRKDDLGGVTLNLPIGENLTWDTTLYSHKNWGQGIWFTPYLSTAASFVINGVGAPDGSGGTISLANSAPISVRTTEYNIDRQGITSALTWNTGNHTFSAGLWTESNDFHQARRFYGLELAAPQRDSLEFMRDPFFTQWEYAFNTHTNEFFLQDVWAVSDELKVNFGFKTLSVENKARAIVDTRFPTSLAGTIKASDDFLPQIGFNYQLNDTQEMFGAVTKNMRAFIAAATGGSPFATSPTNFALLENSGGLSPETSTTYELGWRYNVADLQAVAAVYYVDFKDRLLVNTIGAGIVGNPTVLQNVGDVKTRGAEIGVRWAFMDDWSWYTSLSYNDSEYQDDVLRVDIVAGVPVTTIIPTGGKTVVDTPKELLKSELSYDNGTIFGKLGVDYTGKRYFTYTNDLVSGSGDNGGSVPSYTIFNASLGYRLRDIGFGKNLSIQANVTNITDESYISTIGSNGFGNAGDAQTFLAGAPMQWFVSLQGQF